MGTALSLDGQEVRQTPIHKFDLPPRLPGRAEPQFNGNGQYRLRDPATGKLTSYTRASTVAKTLEDTYMLEQWGNRQLLRGMSDSITLVAELEHTMREYHAGQVPEEGLRKPLNHLSSKAQQVAGSKRAAEFGTAVHAWCEWVDCGYGRITDVPELYQRWVEGHRRALAEAGLSADPYWTERVVLNTRYGIAGTFDRLFWCPDGVLRLGDIKTSRTMDYSWMYFSIQLAIYLTADYVLSLDGMAWEPMPHLDQDVALISHIPREDPDGTHIVPINMGFGVEALATAMVVRGLRTRATREACSVLYEVGSNDPQEQRRRTARYLLEVSETADDMAAVWEEYQDVWTDDLTELGRMSLRSATANADA